MTERIKIVGIAAVVAVAAAVVFMFDPTRFGIFPPCQLHKLTGLWCPGCGSTRALHQLLHGNLMTAFRFNPLAILLLPLVAYLAVRRQRAVIKPIWIWTLLGVVVAFGVLRNIPAYPFTLLMP
jgi:hypothetical protein